MKRYSCVLGLVGALNQPVFAQFESDAFRLARESGAVIGAATACGVASDRAAVVWRRILAADTSGPSPAPDRDFRVIHAEAVRQASLRQQNENYPGCANAIGAFKRLEDSATIRR